MKRNRKIMVKQKHKLTHDFISTTIKVHPVNVQLKNSVLYTVYLSSLPLLAYIFGTVLLFVVFRFSYCIFCSSFNRFNPKIKKTRNKTLKWEYGTFNVPQNQC